MANLVAGIISITLGVVMLANVFMTTVKDTNTSTWTSSETTMWALLSIMGIIGLVYGVASVFGLV